MQHVSQDRFLLMETVYLETVLTKIINKGNTILILNKSNLNVASQAKSYSLRQCVRSYFKMYRKALIGSFQVR